ncbi:unnamed protein product [Ectocarpus sp. 8 AP-2014]
MKTPATWGRSTKEQQEETWRYRPLFTFRGSGSAAASAADGNDEDGGSCFDFDGCGSNSSSSSSSGSSSIEMTVRRDEILPDSSAGPRALGTNGLLNPHSSEPATPPSSPEVAAPEPAIPPSPVAAAAAGEGHGPGSLAGLWPREDEPATPRLAVIYLPSVVLDKKQVEDPISDSQQPVRTKSGDDRQQPSSSKRCGSSSTAADRQRQQQQQQQQPPESDPADVELSEVQWPTNAKSVTLYFFDGCVARVAWPSGLERLAFGSLEPSKAAFGSAGRSSNPLGGIFNRRLDRAEFPDTLREIFLGMSFNQPIDRVAWPDGLERMSLPGFNQPFEGVRWPRGLKSLEFLPPGEILLREDPEITLERLNFTTETGFNQSLGANNGLPASLERLWLSDATRPQDGVVWPRGLVTLGLGDSFPNTALRFEWPPTLRRLYLVDELSSARRVPRGCEVKVLMNCELNDPEWNAGGMGALRGLGLEDMLESFEQAFGGGVTGLMKNDRRGEPDPDEEIPSAFVC